jgi:hypothetical protein
MSNPNHIQIFMFLNELGTSVDNALTV